MRKTEANIHLSKDLSIKTKAAPFFILLSVCPGTFLSHFSAGLVNIALPDLSLYFQAPLSITQWIVTGYLLAIMLCLPVMGNLSDKYGKKIIHNSGYIVFGIGIVLSGFSFSLALLLMARILQGVGAAMLQSANIAIISEHYPEGKRGKALGIIGTAVGVGALLGPSVGGLLINWFSWRVMFWIQIPIVIAAFILASKFIPKDATNHEIKSFDYLGAMLFGIFITFIMFVLNEIGEGEINKQLLIAGLAAMLSFLLFVWRLQKNNNPFIDVKILSQPMVCAGSLIIVVSYMATFSTLVLLPFYLRGVLGVSPSLSGLLIMSYPLLLAVIGPISGAFSDRFGHCFAIIIGLILMIASFAGLSMLSTVTPVIFVVFLLCLLGFSMGILNSPNYNLIIHNVPFQYLGIITSTIALLRNFGMALGTALGVTFMNYFVEGALTKLMNVDNPKQAGNVMTGFHSFFLLIAMLTACVTVYFIILNKKVKTNLTYVAKR
ncbi:MFS transporter [Aeribacillus composti]|nr:MFS transporter [Aeribacillus composti]